MKDSANELIELINSIPVTEENKAIIQEIRQAVEEDNIILALQKLNELPVKNNIEIDNYDEEDNGAYEETMADKQNSDNEYKEFDGKKVKVVVKKESKKKNVSIYPKELSNIELEHEYIGILLKNPEAIVKYYFTFDNCYFEDEVALNLYKRILFTDGEKYAPENAKKGFNFSRENEETNKLEEKLKKEIIPKNYDMEKIYIELRKMFTLRKAYESVPIKFIQDKIVEIKKYELYEKMSISEIESAVEQVNVTGKFKQAILNEDLTKFLELGDNNLTNGLTLPFPILSSVFKGVRKGETMAFAMPSNAGKSRLTIDLAAYTAYIHKKKVLVISNEMSEEKMKLCLITTILNNPEIQKLHGQKISKTEGELLEFKFRPDNIKGVKVDENGFVIKEQGETQKQFVNRLSKISSEFNSTIKATDWVNKQINNSIYFINITDHTNDELKKVIMNYYYKEKIEYIFYDTLKTDTDNIGNGEELKKTATILSNLAQNFNIYICSTLQLTESVTLPINLNVNDLAVSRTVKEVLDTLCLIKQINSENYDDYEYSLNEVDNKFYDIEKSKNPDVRYYACVVDKNRAGAKPKLLFKLNLAYNTWEELGYLRLKQK